MAGTWQALTNQPAFQTSTMMLLTDGRVMVQEEATQHWHALTADSGGSYMNGTWSTLADMKFWRRYYASGILKDGRMIVVGGEQNGDFPDTNKGEIYDPISDTWTPIPTPPGWPIVGDGVCCVLPDGRLMIGALTNPSCIIYDPASNSWSPAASKAVRSNEETWVLLPDNTIVTPQCWAPYQTEKYIISTNTWKNEGALPGPLVDPVMHEIGPGMLMYNGKVIFFGAANVNGHGNTAIYSPPAIPTGTGSWAAGPNIPKVGGQTMVCNDCPATLLPNGKVLFAAANFLNNDWGSPIIFFEYDPTTNTISQAPTPPNNKAQLYWSRLMLLPSGQVLFSPSSNNVQCYTPDSGPQEAWRPVISAIIPHGTSAVTDYYLLKGTQLNGLSQANMYGDDCASATNYPIIRLQNTTTNKVYYAQAHDFSTMGVATGASLQSVRFSLPYMPYGNYDLCVVANGISSHCVNFCFEKPSERCCCDCCVCCKHAGKEDGCCCEGGAPDPKMTELAGEMKRLQNTVNRLLASVVLPEKPAAEAKKTPNAGAEEPKEPTK